MPNNFSLQIPDSLKVHIKSFPPKPFLSFLSFSSILSFLALIVSGISLYYTLCPGKAVVFPVSAYAIVTGVDNFPSHHLVLPMEIANKGNRPVLIRQPSLVLTDENDNVLKFLVAGEYRQLTDEYLSKDYVKTVAFNIESHSGKVINILFHIENWWDKSKEGAYKFKFTKGIKYQVRFNYYTEKGEYIEKDIGAIEIYDTDKLLPDSKHWWGFWVTQNLHGNKSQ